MNTRRDDLLYWWPVVARYGGLAAALIDITYSAVTHTAPDAGALTFFGSLTLVPIIFERQERRNRKREEAEEESSM